MKDTHLNKRLIRSFLVRRIEEQQAVIDAVPVFSRRYNAAVEALEEVEELLGALSTLH